MIPMLGGSHYFLWCPCCVGVPILRFSAPLRRKCLKHCFSDNSQMIYWLLEYLLIMDAACCCTFNAELRKCASRHAWGSPFGFRCSIGELLRCERFDTTCKNVLPTLRWDHDLDFNVLLVHGCDATILWHHWKTSSGILKTGRWEVR